jgi:hypothetical protein
MPAPAPRPRSGPPSWFPWRSPPAPRPYAHRDTQTVAVAASRPRMPRSGRPSPAGHDDPYWEHRGTVAYRPHAPRSPGHPSRRRHSRGIPAPRRHRPAPWRPRRGTVARCRGIARSAAANGGAPNARRAPSDRSSGGCSITIATLPDIPPARRQRTDAERRGSGPTCLLSGRALLHTEWGSPCRQHGPGGAPGAGRGAAAMPSSARARPGAT